jgi:hypothetical protein
MLQAATVPFADAWKVAKANPNRTFNKSRGDGSSGSERIRTDDMPIIAIEPKFKLSPNGKFFTIGSCFARNIEVALAKLGVQCITSAYLIAPEYYEETGPARNGALNAYTPHSMRDLVNIIDRPNRDSIGLLDVGNDEWFDMLLSGLKGMSRAEAGTIRAMMLDTYRQLASADTVVLTLGYTEAWYDSQDQIFVNRSPAGNMKMIKRAGERYAFTNGIPADVYSIVDQTMQDIHRITSGRAKVIVTTSPVPLHATFTTRDIVSANLYSKSVLHSTAISVSQKYDFVDYFPSYELVMYSNPVTTWMEDGVHIHSSRVGKVIDLFAKSYFE